MKARTKREEVLLGVIKELVKERDKWDMKEQIKKIIENNTDLYFQEDIEGINIASQEITDHVFQFIKWFTGKDYTIEELYNFWYFNVFSKTKKG